MCDSTNCELVTREIPDPPSSIARGEKTPHQHSVNRSSQSSAQTTIECAGGRLKQWHTRHKSEYGRSHAPIEMVEMSIMHQRCGRVYLCGVQCYFVIVYLVLCIVQSQDTNEARGADRCTFFITVSQLTQYGIRELTRQGQQRLGGLAMHASTIVPTPLRWRHTPVDTGFEMSDPVMALLQAEPCEKMFHGGQGLILKHSIILQTGRSLWAFVSSASNVRQTGRKEEHSSYSKVGTAVHVSL